MKKEIISAINLKDNLLENYPDFFADNDYLNKYVDLIIKNLDRIAEKNKTQKHHIIPVHYYAHLNNIKKYSEARKLAGCDPNNFLINMLYRDHVLAHYYLSFCVKDSFCYANENAVFHVLGNKHYIETIGYTEERKILESLDKWQELYEDMARRRSIRYTGRKCKPNTEKHKQQISAKNKGNIYVRKKLDDNSYIVKKAKTKEEFDEYINDGWEKGNYPRHLCKAHVPGASTQGESISIRKKGKKCITNGKKIKYVDSSELEYYNKLGWTLGRINYESGEK